jgi:uncharacterized protein YbaR (Trm112 family)
MLRDDVPAMLRDDVPAMLRDDVPAMLRDDVPAMLRIDCAFVVSATARRPSARSETLAATPRT